MALGYDGKLYILAFDHRGSFQKKMFGIEGDPTPEETATIADAKQLIYEGMVKAVERGAEAGATGVLVDEQFGGDIPRRGEGARPEARDAGREERPERVRLPVRRRLRRPHRELRPRLLKVLVRYNPDGDAEMNERQLGRAQAPRRLAARERPPVPVRAARAGRAGTSCESVGGDTDRYDAELRPELMRRAIEDDPGRRHRGRHLEDRGRRRAGRREMLAEQTRSRRRPRRRRLRAARPRRQRREGRPLAAPGRPGRRLRRLRDRPLDLVGRAEGLPRRLDRRARTPPTQIADNYLRFVKVYEGAEQGAHV